MNPEMEQAKAALKAVMAARSAGKPIDLSALPEPLRRKLQAQLQKLPPEMQKELLARGAPILDKAIERASHGAGSSTHGPSNVLPVYSSHYNNTVQAGDRMQLTIGRVAMFFGMAALAYYVWLQVQTVLHD